MQEDEREYWRNPSPPMRLPPLPAGVEVTALALGVMAPAPGGRRLEALAEVEAADDGDNARSYIAGSDGRIRAFDMADKPLAEGALPPGAQVAHLGIGGDHVLAALSDGGVAIYDRALTLERRVQALEQPSAPPPRDRAGMIDSIARRSQGWPSHALISLDYDPVRGRLVWASTGHELGVLDVASGRTLAALPGTASVEGVDQMAFLGARTIAAVAAGRLWVWDPYDGRRADRAGSYQALTPLRSTRILAAKLDGEADLIDLDGERFRLELRRTICLLADGGCGAQRGEDASAGRPSRPPTLELSASPDGREIAVLEWPEMDLPGNGGHKGRLAVLSADTLALSRSFVIDECEDDSPLRFGARDIAACGTRHDRATLAVLPDEAGRSGGASPKPGTDGLFDFLGPNGRRTAVGAATIGVAKSRDGYESIAVENAGGELTALLATQATRDASGTHLSDRAQLRTDSMVVPSPDGSRFLIASRGTNGALQLWCTPTEGIAPYPAEPARPDLLEADGITEIAVAGFPGWVNDAIEIPEGVLILGGEVAAADAFGPPKPGLWSYDPATRKVARLELPAAPAPSGEAETWERFDTDPAGTSIWLVGKHHLALRETEGGWSVFALPPGTTNQVAPIGDRLAVHVGLRICNGAKPCAPGAQPSCFDVTLIGAVPASAAASTRSFDGCVGTVAPFSGGFVALGGLEVGFRDGRWVGASDPLVAAAARAHASDGFGRGDQLVLGVGRSHLDLLGLVDGQPRRTIALPFEGRPSPVAASPGHAASIWIAPDAGEGALVDVDANGKASVYGRGAFPAWAVVSNLRPRGGTRALWWHGGTALIGFDAKHWTAVFNPTERARLLASRRVGY
jgi:hypothetical protein